MRKKNSQPLFSLVAAIAIAALAIIAMSAPARANPLGPFLVFDQPAFKGNGCPTGASVSFAPDNNSMTILFDNYLAEAGGTTHKRTAAKTCAMRLPIQVPDGYTMGLLEVDYRGFNGLPDGAKSHMQFSYRLADRRAVPIRATTKADFVGPLADVYTVTDKPVLDWLYSTGGTVIFTVTTSIKVTTNRTKDDAQTTIDTVDVAESRGVRPAVRGITFHFKLLKAAKPEENAPAASARDSNEF